MIQYLIGAEFITAAEKLEILAAGQLLLQESHWQRAFFPRPEGLLLTDKLRLLEEVGPFNEGVQKVARLEISEAFAEGAIEESALLDLLASQLSAVPLSSQEM